MSMTELRSDWLVGYYALGRDKFSAKTISINNFTSYQKGLTLRAFMGDEGSGYLLVLSLRILFLKCINNSSS